MEAFPVGDELGSTPEPTILQPAGTAPTPAYPALELQQGEHLRVGEDVQFSEEVEDRGLLESSTRLKPHEAQNYRKKALWVSWASIIVTLALAVAAFKSRDVKLPTHEPDALCQNRIHPIAGNGEKVAIRCDTSHNVASLTSLAESV